MYKVKARKFITLPRLAALGALLALVVISAKGPLDAQAPFTQGYGADEVLQRGMIVRLNKDDTTKVTALPFDEMEAMHGVVTDPNDAPVTLSSEGQKVFVATGGQFEVLVSNQNGPVEAGDYIAISALNGVGMKAGESEAIVVGRALREFNGHDRVASTAQITDTDGSTRQVSLGMVLADISVSRNPILKTDEPNLPAMLRRISESIAGKQVSAIRVYLATIIFVSSTLLAFALLYGGVKSAITSIGRNPLSKKSILKSMLQVILTGLIIFISGLFGVYLLLRI